MLAYGTISFVLTHCVRQDYGFDYSEDGSGSESGNADVGNLYYTAKCTFAIKYSVCTTRKRERSALAKREDEPEQALKEFRAIVDQEEEKGDWYGSAFHNQ